MSVAEDTFESRPNYVLHPIRGMVWATFWGTPFAAGIVMAINYWRVGRISAACNVIVTGFLFTLCIFSILFVLPEETIDQIPNLLFAIPQLIVVYAFASMFQKGLIEQHEAEGGTTASAWPSVGIGLLCLPVVLAAVFGIAFLFDASLGTPVEFGNDEIYLSGEATEEDAGRLAEILTEVEYFGTGGATVDLGISSEGCTILFVVQEGAWNDAESVDWFRELGEHLLEAGFPSPLIVQLSDEYFSVQKTIPIE